MLSWGEFNRKKNVKLIFLILKICDIHGKCCAFSISYSSLLLGVLVVYSGICFALVPDTSVVS